MKHALGRWPPFHTHHSSCGLEILLCSFLRTWPEWLESQKPRFSVETGLIPSGVGCPFSLARATEQDHLLFLLPLQSWIQLLMAEGPLKPPKIASCWKDVMQCTPQYAYWFLFLVLIKIYFSSLQVNSDLGLAAFHICNLGQWILVLTSGAINSCLLLRYFNVNKWPHGSGRGATQQTQQLNNQSLFSQLSSWHRRDWL